jgi:Holliday junction resolvase RusA-like endonuclease
VSAVYDAPASPDLAVTFTVYGTPAPKGSTKAFMPKGARRPIVTHDNKRTKPWQIEVQWAAREHCPERLDGPVAVALVFFVPRPKMSAKKAAATRYSIKKPDIDKIARLVLDSLTGYAFHDDAQVAQLTVQKFYENDDERPGVHVRVCPLRQ